jgi:type IV pilus assembly protein PilN
MRVPINLASQPFRHKRAILIGSSLLAVLMVGTLFMLVSLIKQDRRNKVESMRQLAVAQKRLAMVQKDLAAVNQELRQPKNATVLENSILLNQILMRKGISWTRIFADLEKVVPYNVRILQIRPQIESQNRIYLQMVIGADTPPHLNSFLEKLEASDVFGATMVTTIVPPSQTDPLFRYQVSVTYAQKL